METEYVIHLDADDQLDPRYVETMLASDADVRVPYVSYSHRTAVLPQVAGHTHECSSGCLPDGNWIVVGAMTRADLLREVGGWRDFELYEDWDLWLRCYLHGATFATLPKAVYKARVRKGSRNRSQPAGNRFRVHQEIARANGVPVPA